MVTPDYLCIIINLKKNPSTLFFIFKQKFMSKNIFAQKIQGFRVYEPREFGTGLNTKELTIAILLDEKDSARRYPDTYQAEFHINFRYNTTDGFWWLNSELEVKTAKPEIAAFAAKFYAQFVDFCDKNILSDQIPACFVQFCEKKNIPQVWYDGNVGRIFSDPKTKSFSWSYNGQEKYGNVLAMTEKEGLKKIRRSYPKGEIILTEQSLDLREYNRFSADWLVNP